MRIAHTPAYQVTTDSLIFLNKFLSLSISPRHPVEEKTSLLICRAAMASSFLAGELMPLFRKSFEGDAGPMKPLWWAVAVISCLTAWIVANLIKKNASSKKFPPAVPGLPLVGNLLQLREKKPHKTFTAWAEEYGPIYTLKMGVQKMVVINSSELAKEVMLTKYPSISTRKMSKALSILTGGKTMVATSDYCDLYRMLKKLLVQNLLGPTPQKANQKLRERTFNQLLDGIFDKLNNSSPIIDIREHLKMSLFPFAMYQVLGRDPDSVFVKEMGRDVPRCEIFKALVMDPLEAVIEVDWRDFFPFFSWVPNSVEAKINAVHTKRKAIVSALIDEQRQLLSKGKPLNCYLDILLTEATHLTEHQLLMITWEPIIESSDTTMITIEWAMYEIAKNPVVQERLFQELNEVSGSKLVLEDDLPKLKYLTALVKETLRTYPPVSLIPPRHIDEDVQLGGFDVKKGWQVIINVYGINHNKETWKEPELWNPDRVLNDQSLDLGLQDYRAIPFGAGKRLCAGISQAICIISMIIAHLVQHFEWRLLPEEQSMNVVDTVFLTTHRLYPLKAMATPRIRSRLLSDRL